jgi:hypothetical protein
MKVCIYCGGKKPDNEFSDEHIWPDALGGDFLPRDVWRTNDVCQSCNSMSGLFVDGSFIRSWMGKAELSSGALEYLAGKGKPAAIPLDYLGPIQNVPTPLGHVADYWAGPCGANIVHIRPDDGSEQWTTYAGGNPIVKKAKAGRAYIGLTSGDLFWVGTSLLSFKRHFARAERFVVTKGLPPEWGFKEPNPNDPVQVEDMKAVEAVFHHGRADKNLHIRAIVSVDLGHRMLSKLGLAVGYKLLGPAFLQTDYAKNLRRGMREADIEKRKNIPVRGAGFFGGPGLGGAEKVLAWPGGWVLMVNIVQGNLSLCVISPSGRPMTVVISDEQALVGTLNQKYKDGVIWITIPADGKAVGPISLPEYLAHQTNTVLLPLLVSLASKRGDRTKLPPCRSSGEEARLS